MLQKTNLGQSVAMLALMVVACFGVVLIMVQF